MSIISRQGLRAAILGAFILAAGVVTSNAQSRYYGGNDRYYGNTYYEGQRSSRNYRRYRYRQLKRYQRQQLANLLRQQRRQRRQLRRAYRNDRYNRGNVYYRGGSRYYNNYGYRRN